MFILCDQTTVVNLDNSNAEGHCSVLFHFFPPNWFNFSKIKSKNEIKTVVVTVTPTAFSPKSHHRHAQLKCLSKKFSVRFSAKRCSYFFSTSSSSLNPRFASQCKLFLLKCVLLCHNTCSKLLSAKVVKNYCYLVFNSAVTSFYFWQYSLVIYIARFEKFCRKSRGIISSRWK